jgi:hypothetical protein
VEPQGQFDFAWAPGLRAQQVEGREAFFQMLQRVVAALRLAITRQQAGQGGRRGQCEFGPGSAPAFIPVGHRQGSLMKRMVTGHRMRDDFYSLMQKDPTFSRA